MRLALVIWFLGLTTCQLPEVPILNPLVEIDEVEIDLKDSLVTVSTPISGTVSGLTSLVGDSLELRLIGFRTYFKFVWPIGQSEINFNIPSNYNFESGRKLIQAYFQGMLLSEQDITVFPGDRSNQINLFTGPKSISAGDEEVSMVVALPQDEYNNVIAEQSLVTFRARYQNGIQPEKQKAVENQLSHIRIKSLLKTGPIIIGIKDKNSISREQQIQVIPSQKIKEVSIFVDEYFPYASGHHYMKISTSKIIDEHGNTIPDGSIIFFHVFQKNKLESEYKGFTINGIGHVRIENPELPAKWKIIADILNKKSNILSLVFEQYATKMPVSINESNKTITIGPIEGILGQFVADGYLVSIKLSQAENIYDFNLFTENGFAKLNWTHRYMNPGTYSVKIVCGGIESTHLLSIE